MNLSMNFGFGTVDSFSVYPRFGNRWMGICG